MLNLKRYHKNTPLTFLDKRTEVTTVVPISELGKEPELLS